MEETGEQGMIPDPVGMVWHNGHIDEDVLTGAVFSTLRYVSAAFVKFLARLARLNGLDPNVFLTSGRVTFEPWPGWTIRDGLGSEFSKMDHSTAAARQMRSEKGSLAPDVIIRADNWQLVIEAEDSKPYNAVQLVQQYVLACHGATEAHKDTYHVLVGPTIGRPRGLDAEIRAIWGKHEHAFTGGGGSLAQLRSRLLWIGWAEIEGVFQEAIDGTAEEVRYLLTDVCALLRDKGYREVNPPHAAIDAIRTAASATRSLVEHVHRADSFPSESLAQIVPHSDTILRLADLCAVGKVHHE